MINIRKACDNQIPIHLCLMKNFDNSIMQSIYNQLNCSLYTRIGEIFSNEMKNQYERR
jgi:hypothetical protein